MGSENTLGIPLSKVSPAYLHANSTWVFSAFAEIIDNAYDPDVKATDLSIDKEDIGGNTCVVFQDDGIGMSKDNLLKMLSFGFCEKGKYGTGNNHQPIGQYGNGFKFGSMRIGSDALVLTLFEEIVSIGFLSQT
ncbi:MORC family CW-type Zinc finger protein 3 [Plakobranchus ocellatus]|uniref:MORC family CW-type Zinc finger protein 3 n=1 Tax=Plakobranchus ocellatus TaxID=259542 RepID=A0AAV4BM35_9GAST|nr:MORC family CW-type Zinc finger protein 3 [Plakobranchus ocellatus]